MTTNVFYLDNGLVDRIYDRVDTHIRKNRDVVEMTLEHDMNPNPDFYYDWLCYSAYPTDPDVDNLDEIAVTGKVQFVSEAEDFFGNIKTRADYKSEVVENPTWLDVCLLANDMINQTGDNHHIFLECVDPVIDPNDPDGVKLYTFGMGS